MHKAIAKIEIGTSPQKVFEFMTNPRNLPSVYPSLIEVRNAQMNPGGAHSFDYTYKMAGVPMRGHSSTIEVVQNERVVTKTTGIPATFRWTYEARGPNKTALSVEVEYSIPTPVLGALAEAVIAKINQHELKVVLENVKAAVEPRAATNAERHASA